MMFFIVQYNISPTIENNNNNNIIWNNIIIKFSSLDVICTDYSNQKEFKYRGLSTVKIKHLKKK